MDWMVEGKSDWGDWENDAWDVERTVLGMLREGI